MKPESLFCKMLASQYQILEANIDEIINLPIRAIRDVKSNITRVERVVYNIVLAEVEKIESLVIEILFLDRISTLEGFNNFCQIAFQCKALINLLTDSNKNYLSFLSPSVVSQLSTNYALFEREVCQLGIRNLIGNFTNQILDELREKLVALRNRLFNELRLNQILAAYEKILESSGIINLLNKLKEYINCAFEICDFASTATNKIEDISSKLYVFNTAGANWDVDLTGILGAYDKKDAEIKARIDSLINKIDTKDIHSTIRIKKDQIMKL